jgi:NAD(P)-dependent dehydrogenase (short-subunit alcohol dehydrogenase family)
MKLLEGKVAIITGASAGIGRAAAEMFAEHGCQSVLVARGEDELAALAEDLSARGCPAVAWPGDVRETETHETAVAMALARFGRLDIALNNAGTVGAMRPLAELTDEEWNETLETNLTSAFLASRAQIPAMLESGGGSLIFTSSFVGSSVGMPGMGAYAAAKAGLSGLVKGLTADYANQGIRANALMAGGTDTAMAGDTAQKAWAASLHPVGRIAAPEEIAQATLFLASDMASFVYGSNLWADGGNAATKVSATARS